MNESLCVCLSTRVSHRRQNRRQLAIPESMAHIMLPPAQWMQNMSFWNRSKQETRGKAI